MNLSALDVAIIVAFLVSVVVIGSLAARRAGRSTADFFLSGRSMPWWLLGVSMVACTFSCDTPNLVTDIVRTGGVAGNWAWWAFLLTGMLTVFVYAKLWRRSALDTDLGFYEIRYSGRPAAVLRGFRALYLGVLFNVLVMATVSLAAIKIGQVMFGLRPAETLFWASVGVAIYAVLGGLTGSIWADFYQYSVAMFGAIAAAVYAVASPKFGVGSLRALVSRPELVGKLSFLPPPPEGGDLSGWVGLFVLPLAIQWWNVWYPGAEPGGGGYVAQRMLSAKNERHAVGATLLFNVLHYAVRPWPWILVALVSLVAFAPDPPEARAAARQRLASPELATAVAAMDAGRATEVPDAVRAEIRLLRAQAAGVRRLAEAFPNVHEQFLRHDIAYPAMIAQLPPGLLGLVVASLIAAYMSTIATHLNWGSSYVVQDFYRRFVRPSATERELVAAGRIVMLALLLLAARVALWMTNAKASFDLLLAVGAGTGLIYILRWFWWRLNAWSEISAMVISFAIAAFFAFGAPHLGIEEWMREAGWLRWMGYSDWKLVFGIAGTTAGWLTVTLLTPPVDRATLRAFYRRVRPGGPGWQRVVEEARRDGEELVDPATWDVPRGILCMTLGCAFVWAALFAIGSALYGRALQAAALGAVSAAALLLLMSAARRLRFD
ncbi:MAG: Na+:solute symporter [Kiritimatiellae bacterium]|nr:Na+:solute symporter [Kiritimatiellia bacterium]